MPHDRSQEDITGLLKQGDMEKLMPLIYEELKRSAQQVLRKNWSHKTLNTTGLVHEVYLRLVRQEIDWQSRAHFFAVAAKAMRWIILNYAQQWRTQKRGEGFARTTLDAVEAIAVVERADEFIALDEALSRLEEVDERQSQIVHYRFYAGLTIEEIARLLSLSPATVKREWTAARLWLYRQIQERSRPS